MEIELQNESNVDLSLINDSVEINIDKENQNIDFEEKEIELEEREFDLELVHNNIEIELGASSIPVPATNNHADLYNLEYENSGHTGFQKEMDSLTNLEIERMWNSI